MQLKIKVIPNSSRNKLVIKDGKITKVKIAAPPVKGKANKELIKFLAKELNVPKSSIKIVKGGKKRNKILEIDNHEILLL